MQRALIKNLLMSERTYLKDPVSVTTVEEEEEIGWFLLKSNEHVFPYTNQAGFEFGSSINVV